MGNFELDKVLILQFFPQCGFFSTLLDHMNKVTFSSWRILESYSRCILHLLSLIKS